MDAKKIRIARLIAEGDIGTATDFIDFNNPSDPDFKDSKREGAYIDTIEVITPEGIGSNLTAERADGDVQPLGVLETTYIINGFITQFPGNDNDGVNSIIAKLRTWKKEAQAIQDVLEGGVFAIKDENDVDNNLIPIGTGPNTKGLIFQNYKKINIYNTFRTNITLTFRVSRGLDI